MKKLLSVMLALLILVSAAGVAFAADLNLSDYTDEEIVEMLAALQQELLDRKIRKAASLAPGRYVVGEEIPAGAYDITCRYEGERWANIMIFDAEGEQIFDAAVYDAGNEAAEVRGEGTWHIRLSEGDVLEITGPATLTVATGVLFE